MKPVDPWRLSGWGLAFLMLTSAFCVVAAVALGLGPDWIDVAKISSSMGHVSLTLALIAWVSRIERTAKAEFAKVRAEFEQFERRVEGLAIMSEVLATEGDLIRARVEEFQCSRGTPEDIQDAEVIE